MHNAVAEEIEIGLLKSSGNPVRLKPYGIEELANSVTQYGLLQPLIVRPRGANFEVVAGNRRFLACRRLKWRKIACIIKDLDDREAYELALVENVQRKSITIIEEAKAFKKYVMENGWGSECELGKKIGKSAGYISQRLSFLRLPPDVQDMIAEGEISPSSAREIAHISEPKQIRLVAMASRDFQSSSREIKSMVDTLNQKNNADENADYDIDRKDLKKLVLILRIALIRMSSLCEGLEEGSTKEYVISRRQVIHELIDEVIRFSMKRQRLLESSQWRILEVQTRPRGRLKVRADNRFLRA